MKGKSDCIEQTGRTTKTGGISNTESEQTGRIVNREKGSTDCITRDVVDGF
jgi:hypothetical protein